MLGTARMLLSASLRAWWPHLRTIAWMVLCGTAAYAALAPILAPILAILHELIVLGAAHLIGDLAWYAATGGLLRVLPLDPIYTSAMLLTVGGIERRGLALALSLGQTLHERWPLLFQSPELLAPRAWASAVVAPGSTIISRWLCGIIADATLVLLGLLTIRQARPGRPWLLIAGATIQAHVVVAHLIDAPPALADVEAAGIPFAVAMIFSGDVQAGPRLAETLESLADPVQNVVLGLGMTALAYLPVLALLLVARVVRRVHRHRWRSSAHQSLLTWPYTRSRRRSAALARTTGHQLHPASLGKLLALSALAMAVAVSPLGDLADARTHFLAAAMDENDAILHDLAFGNIPLAESSATDGAVAASPISLTDSPTGGPAPTLSSAVPSMPTPSVVAVTGSGFQYQYTVNGVPQVIRGIGYNVQYRNLPADERVRRLDRDFAELKRAGVNTVFGWEPAEFDTVLLDAAQRHGLGVAPPFELNPEAAYADPAVRERITADVLAWVALHRAHPALRMWAIGNEVLHKLVYPSWMPVRSDPAWEQRAREFATFYVQLIDKVHAADPDHPIVHRDAEDAYLTWLRDAMQAHQPPADTLPGNAQAVGRQRPWFIYGVNSYTPRLAEILTSWTSQGWDTPLLVSEFAPGGMSPADRPQGLREMWKMIRGASSWVLGGSVYAWTTNGPEEVDRVFGLVGDDGRPVDGAWAAISSVYRGAARQVQTERTTPAQAGDSRVWPFARYVVRAVQEGRSADLLPVTANSSIMGDVNNVEKSAPADADLAVQRVRDARRVAWSQAAGVVNEWWVTWQPPAAPNRKLTFAVQEHQDGTLGVQYIYHGPR